MNPETYKFRGTKVSPLWGDLEGYFGARYYNSNLSIWSSVNPLAELRPCSSLRTYMSLRPSNYWLNNLMRLVDPNGEDWEVNETGHIRPAGDKDNHVLYAVKGKGNEQQPIKVDGDIMNSLQSGTENINWKDENYSKTDVTGKEEIAKSMLLFMSNNTDVEWSYWGGKKDEKDFATLATSHKKYGDPYSAVHSLNSSVKGGLSFFVHTHPRSELQGMFSNSTDRNHRDEVRKGSPNAAIGVMHLGRLYDLNGWDGK